ncbi:zinc finger protein 271-like [Neocloeon triangulifer]|uniref:zinc finger protein 271-like n=1 Tax=Neocloeon triangulifer TaxID=2078957 RepID=UPI00286F0821|nr:zinc finger protein 271-like [Neocloeon triangulifer]
MEKHDSKNNDEKSLHFCRLRGCDPGESFFRTIEQLLVEFISAMANVANLCRLCGTNTIGIVRHNIFEGEGLAKKFADKIADCLPVNVSIEDRLPKILCGECSYKLDLLSDFRDVCVKTETLLLSLIDGIKHEVCDVDAEEEEVKGEVVQRRSSRRTSQKRALEEIEESEKEASEDDFCMDDGGDRDDDDEDEEFVVKTPAKKRSRKSGEPKKPESGVCGACGAQTKDLRRHTIAKHTRDFPVACPECPKRFVSRSELNSHGRRAHGAHRKEMSLLCKYCGRSFSRKQYLVDHERKHRDERPFQCATCGNSYYSKVLLKSHERVHTCSSYSFECDLCHMKFTTQTGCRAHRKRHFEENRRFECPACGQRFFKRATMEAHQVSRHTHVKPYECALCRKRFPCKYDLQKHIETHLRIKSQVCEFCGAAYFRADHLRRHKMQQHRELVPAFRKSKEKFPCVPVKVEIVENEKLECSKCQKILKLRHLWIAHEKRPHTHFCQTCLRYFVSYRDYTSHNCIYKCTYCDRKTKSKEKLDLHIYRFHEGNERFVCDICKDEFRTKSSLATHIIAKGFVHTPTVTWCVKCCEDFKTPQWLKKHQLRVHEGKIICHQCTKTFPTKEERMRHTKEMHPRVKEKVKCPQCDLILSCKGGLVKHVDVVHKKLRPFLCPVCGKSYPLKKSLEFHMTMHTGEKNHVCKVCGHKFARIENLKQHMRIHNNEKPYSCEFCGRQFRQCGPLNIHRRTHTGETPYACHLCPQKFISNNHLKLHLNNHPKILVRTEQKLKIHIKRYHEGSKKFTCDICKDELQEKKKPSQGKSDEIKNPSTEKPAKTNEFLAPEFVSLAEPKVETVHEYNVSAKGNFDCDQCGAKFSNQGFWQSHCSRPHQHLCNQCGKLRISRTAEHLCRHQCEKCKIYIDGKDAFTVHQVKCYIRSFTCDLCGFVAYRRQKITNHIKIAHFLKMDEEYKFKSCWCEICKRKFSTSFALQQHKLRKHEGVLMCSVCFKRFETKEERRKHVQETHSKEKVSFECPECGKKLCSKFSVKLHVDNIHRKLRPHLCQVCGSSFITAGHLKLHVMMHTGEKNHVCKDCGHAFARIENLTQHRRIHTNSRPFLCDFCPRSFTQQSSLKCHRRIHTGETPYRCQLCPQSFRTKQQLDQHVKFHPAV